MICGGLASAISKTCFAPAERVKLVLQNQNMIKGSFMRGPYTNVVDAFMRIGSDQGVLSFWKGNGANLMRIVPTYALRFTLFDYFKDLVAVFGGDRNSPWQKMSAGALSGFVTVSVTYPLDLLRTHLSASPGPSKRVWWRVGGLATAIVRRNGIFGGLYKGFFMSAMEITPYLAITLGGYDFLKSSLSKGDDSALGVPASVAIGWVSGLLGSLTCYPMDTVKRQLMLDGGGKEFESKYDGSVRKCVGSLMRNGGLRAFYRGCLLNALKSAPATAMTFVLNDKIRQMWKRDRRGVLF
eukprot:g2558.t1